MLALIGWMRGYCAMVEALEGQSYLLSCELLEIPTTQTTVMAHVTQGDDGRQRRCSNRPMPTLSGVATTERFCLGFDLFRILKTE
jgi:hypothetical protein